LTEFTFAKFSKEDIALDRRLLGELSANIVFRSVMVLPLFFGASLVAAAVLEAFQAQSLLRVGLCGLTCAAGVRLFYVLWCARHGVILNLGSGRSPFLKDLLSRTSGELRRTVTHLEIEDPENRTAVPVHSIALAGEGYDEGYNTYRSSVSYYHIGKLFGATDYGIHP
jgi:hypothetical protein